MKTAIRTWKAEEPVARSVGRLFGMAALISCAAAFICLQTGCRIIPEPQADPTRYYTLAIPENETYTGMKGVLRVGLRTVELAPHLRKGVMVVRKGEYELAYQDYARWAEPLDQVLTRALRIRLQSAASVRAVTVPPFPLDQQRDVDLAVYVARCEGVGQGQSMAARFVASMELIRTGSEPTVVARKTFTAAENAWDGKDFAALAAALSQAVHQFAGEAEALLAAQGVSDGSRR